MGILLRLSFIAISQLDYIHFLWVHECCRNTSSHTEPIYSIGSQGEVDDSDVWYVVLGSWPCFLSSRDQGHANKIENFGERAGREGIYDNNLKCRLYLDYFVRIRLEFG